MRNNLGEVMSKGHLNIEAIKLLRSACFIQKEYFMCFGKYYDQLYKLELIDNEYKVTHLGKQFIKYCTKEGVFKDST